VLGGGARAAARSRCRCAGRKREANSADGLANAARVRRLGELRVCGRRCQSPPRLRSR
jgi:hypothetical protein